MARFRIGHCRALATLVCLGTLPAFGQNPAFKVLVFSATAGFRHDSIPAGITAITELGAAHGFMVDATEDATKFTDSNLAQYAAVVFLNTTGDVLTNAVQQSALQGFIQAGGGWVGIHSAADTHYAWTWYGGLVGAYFASHPAIQTATVRVLDASHPSTAGLPKRWVRSDEWYNFQTNPRGSAHVLATLDETTYTGGTHGPDHPIAWARFYGGGRAWYTAGGHTSESYAEPWFRAHLLGGIQFAAGAKWADVGATINTNWRKVLLQGNVLNPMALEVAPDGRVFYIERAGAVRILAPPNYTMTTAGTLSVDTGREDGLLGIALDPGFSTNQWLYLFYSPAGPVPKQHVSRFTLSGGILDLGSEKILLQIPTQRAVCCHSAGALFTHTNGDLYIATGDNTNPFESNGFDPIDERPGRSAYDAQGTAGNANDLRGKILRIHPEPDGSYTLPAGNLYPPGTPNTRPEIYVMGCRNPFRFAVDAATGWLYWGDVGPDASADSALRGPAGQDEWNQARAAGNFGWPYFVGPNQPYIDYDFATGISTTPFNPAAPINDSPNNTGPQNLPPAQPPVIWYPYAPSARFPELASGGRTAMSGPVYHFQSSSSAPNRLPPYFDGSWIIYEWSRNYCKEVKLDDTGDLLQIVPFLPGLTFLRPMDFKIAASGVAYAIEWGTASGGNNPDAAVVRIDYLGGQPRPSLKAGVNGNGLRLSWPVGGAGYVLESAPGLPAGTGWTSVPNVPTIAAGAYSLDLATTAPARYFRLRQ